MINLPDLAERLIGAGIIQKSFQDCTSKEIEFICEAVMSCFSSDVPVDGWTKPRIENGVLIIPFDCHPDYRWWTCEGKSVTEILEDANAGWEVAKRYIPFITEEEWMNRIIPF